MPSLSDTCTKQLWTQLQYQLEKEGYDVAHTYRTV